MKLIKIKTRTPREPTASLSTALLILSASIPLQIEKKTISKTLEQDKTLIRVGLRDHFLSLIFGFLRPIILIKTFIRTDICL